MGEPEFWWVYSPSKEEWGGLRLATIREMSPGHHLFIIHNELPERNGLRFWEDVSEREGWIKVERVEVPIAKVRALLAPRPAELHS